MFNFWEYCVFPYLPALCVALSTCIVCCLIYLYCVLPYLPVLCVALSTCIATLRCANSVLSAEALIPYPPPPASD